MLKNQERSEIYSKVSFEYKRDQRVEQGKLWADSSIQVSFLLFFIHYGIYKIKHDDDDVMIYFRSITTHNRDRNQTTYKEMEEEK